MCIFLLDVATVDHLQNAYHIDCLPTGFTYVATCLVSVSGVHALLVKSRLIGKLLLYHQFLKKLGDRCLPQNYWPTTVSKILEHIHNNGTS